MATVPSNGALGNDADASIGSTTPLTWPVLDYGDAPLEIDDLWIGNGDGLSGELLVQGGVNLQCTDDIKMCLEAGSVYAKLTVKGAGATVRGLKSLELGEEGTVVVDVDGGTLEIGEVAKPKWNMMVAAGADSNVTIYIRNGGVLEHHGDFAEDDRGGLKIGDGTALIDIGSDSGSGGGTTDPVYLSPIYTFNTMNTAPVVNAGADVATWLDNGPKVVHLDGVVSDEDGGPGPATLLWTVIAEPNESNPAQISDPLAANPTVTIEELGSYTLQLEAGDGEHTTTDTMQIVLYADSCEHAQNQEGFERLAGDTNDDCNVDYQDLVNLGLSWLEENYSIQ